MNWYSTYLLLAVFTLVGCSNGLQFAKKVEGKNDKPPGSCIDSVNPDFQAPPSLVEIGQALSLAYESDSVTWTIEEPNSNIVSLNGDANYTVSQIGSHRGKLEALDECSQIKVLYFNFDAFLPVGASRVIVNSGDQYTSNNQVNLRLLSDGATEMYVSNNANCNGGSWQAYQPDVRHSLSASNADVNVYAKFRNPVGNESACVNDSIIHDDVNPDLAISGAPAVITNQNSASFSMQASDNFSGVDTYFCILDGGNINICGPSKTYSNLNEGNHTFSVRVSDKAGNLSAWINHTWLVDSVKPSLQFTQTPNNPSQSSTANFAFKGGDVGSGIDAYECSLDQAAFAVCSSPEGMNVADGSHAYSVRVKDKAGNVSDTISYNWVVDSSGPVIVITSAPANPTNQVDANFNFTVTDSGVGVDAVTCQLGQQAVAPCVDSASYANLVDGSYTFKVVATDRSGLSSQEIYTWVVDTRTQEEEVTVPAVVGNKKDILFIVDVSASMGTEMLYIRNEMSRFLRLQLGNIDWQIGVTTTDGRAPTRTGIGGRLIPFKYGRPTVDILKPDARNRERALQMALWTRNLNRSWTEPIRVAQLALELPQNAPLFRDEAHLDVVIITDGDEISGNVPTDPANSPEGFIDYMATSHPEKSYKVHSLSVRPGDSQCFWNYGQGLYSEAVFRLTQLTGGIEGSVCGSFTTSSGAVTYARQLAPLGQAVTPSNYTVNLSCEPEDANHDGEGDVVVSYDPVPNPLPSVRVVGKKVILTPYPPVGTKIKLTYRCKVN